jgi:hypothetical protein
VTWRWLMSCCMVLSGHGRGRWWLLFGMGGLMMW